MTSLLGVIHTPSEQTAPAGHDGQISVPVGALTRARIVMKTEVSRRFFLGGALALVGAAAVPSHFRLSPLATIFANGVDDDSAGFEALFRGMPIDMRTEAVSLSPTGEVIVCDGSYFFAKDLIVTPGRTLSILAREGIVLTFDRGAGIIAETGSTLNMTRVTLTGKPGPNKALITVKPTGTYYE